MNAERALLLRLSRGPVGGDVLAAESGQTRAAVWKRVAALRAAGIAIEARPRLGYALARPLDLLDAPCISAALAAPVRARLDTLEVAWSIDSTNAELLRRPAPVAGPCVLLAERQTGGRGRRGRHWTSPLAANVYLSLARVFDGGLARLGGLGLVAGVAAADALQALGASGVRLKWPNDLVLVDARGRLRKLGGVLVEGGGENAGPVRAVIGVGLNVAMPAAAAVAIDQPWADLSQLLPDRTRNEIAAALVEALVTTLDRFDRDGLATFVTRYAALDALAGRAVQVQAGRGSWSGTAAGLAPDGALCVRTCDGERRLHAGEVSVRTLPGGQA